MKQLYPLSALVLFPMLGMAQPVLDFSTNGTLPGDAFVYQAGPWVDPGSGGADQIWDFTGLTTDSVINILFVDPAETPEAASFPSATVAAEEQGGNAYSQFDATGGYFHGLALPGFTPIVYSDPMQMASFPATMGTTWIDDFAADYDVVGNPVSRTGTINATCDGYGSLLMPGGTLTDVLRVSATESYTDDFGLGTSTFDNVYTDFLQADTHYPIVHIFSITTTFFGNTTTITGSQWMSEVSTGVAHTVGTRDEMRVRADVGSIVVALPRTVSNGTLALLNSAGVILQQRSLGTGAPDRTMRFDAQGYASGVYVVRLTSDNNMAVGRVVLE